MGRPALLGSHPRGPQYRGVQVPPHYGNRPRWRKSWHSSRHKTDTPKALSWRLASPHYANTHPTPSWKKGITKKQTETDKTANETWHNSDIEIAGGLLSGGAARRRPGTTPQAAANRRIAGHKAAKLRDALPQAALLSEAHADIGILPVCMHVTCDECYITEQAV